jgi:glucose-1-phosphate adenylyltransferase
VGLADSPDEVFASMGNYVFRTQAMIDALREDALDPTSKHDLGGNIIPMMVKSGGADVYDFANNLVPGSTERDRGYWRDVGTLDAYYEAHMDLISAHPVFNLYNDKWPIYTGHDPLPPAKFVHNDGDRVGRALDSLVSPGVIVSGGTAIRSILSPKVVLHSHSLVEDSVLMENVKVGRGAIVRRAIIDKNVVIPDGARIGFDLEYDRTRFAVTRSGVVVIGKNEIVDR